MVKIKLGHLFGKISNLPLMALVICTISASLKKFAQNVDTNAGIAILTNDTSNEYWS